MMMIIATIISMHVCNLYSIRKTFEKPDMNEGYTSDFYCIFFTLIHSRSFCMHIVCIYNRCQVSCICVSAHLEESIQEMHDILDLILILYFCASAKHDVIFFLALSCSSISTLHHVMYAFIFSSFFPSSSSFLFFLHFHLQQEGRENLKNEKSLN